MSTLVETTGEEMTVFNGVVTLTFGLGATEDWVEGMEGMEGMVGTGMLRTGTLGVTLTCVGAEMGIDGVDETGIAGVD